MFEYLGMEWVLGFRFGWERGTACKRLVKRISKKNKILWLLFVKGEESCGLWGLSCLRERESMIKILREREREEMVRWWVMRRTELTDAAGSTSFHVSHSLDELGAWQRVTWVPLWYHIWRLEFYIVFGLSVWLGLWPPLFSCRNSCHLYFSFSFF